MSRNRRPHRWCQPLVLRLLLGALPLGALGCQVTPQQIEQWKGTQKGPGKLRDVLADADQSAELRALAALALIQIGQGEAVDEALQRAAEPARRDLARRMLPALLDQLGRPPEPRQAAAVNEAKDGLFRLRALLEGDDRARADQALSTWICQDLDARMSAGSINAERILTTIGPSAAAPLLALLERLPADSPTLLPAASLLGRVADPAGKRRGAAALARLPEQSDRVLQALGALGGAEAQRALAGLAERGPGPLRGKAFAAMGPDPSAVPLALRVAGDRKEPGAVREAAFAYLERAGHIALDGLCQLIRDPGDPSEKGEVTRFRAVEAALDAGGAAAVPQVLAALPPERAYSQEDLSAFVARRITALKDPATLPALRAALRSPSWVARAAAVLALSELSRDAQDLQALGTLAGDGAALRGKGWSVATVGELAKARARSNPPP